MAAKVRLKPGGEDRDAPAPGAVPLRGPAAPINLMVVVADIMPAAPRHVLRAPHPSWRARRVIHAAWTGMGTAWRANETAKSADMACYRHGYASSGHHCGDRRRSWLWPAFHSRAFHRRLGLYRRLRDAGEGIVRAAIALSLPAACIHEPQSTPPYIEYGLCCGTP